MEIVVKFENRKGEIKEIKIHKPKPLAIPIFMAKIGKYANKDHKITEFYCDDYQFLSLIMQSLPPTCKISMSKEI